MLSCRPARPGTAFLSHGVFPLAFLAARSPWMSRLSAGFASSASWPAPSETDSERCFLGPQGAICSSALMRRNSILDRRLSLDIGFPAIEAGDEDEENRREEHQQSEESKGG